MKLLDFNVFGFEVINKVVSVGTSGAAAEMFGEDVRDDSDVVAVTGECDGAETKQRA
jgi:hypothetical protein